MYILPVSTIQNQRNQQFKGIVDKSIDTFVRNCIRHYCIDYKKSLTTTQVIDVKKLEEIKNNWYDVLKLLKEKAKSMHKDTILYAQDTVSSPDVGVAVRQEEKYIHAKNKNISSDISIQRVYDYNSSTGTNYIIKYDDFKNLVENLDSKDIDKKLLNFAESNETASTKVLNQFRQNIGIKEKHKKHTNVKAESHPKTQSGDNNPNDTILYDFLSQNLV